MQSKHWGHSEGIYVSTICFKKGVVGKLSYKAKGPFVITVDVGYNSFEIRLHNKTKSARRKYM